MKKLRVLLTSALAVALLFGAVAPVQASEEKAAVPLTVDEISTEELEALDKLELVPEPTTDGVVSFDGGFRGVWGSNNSTEVRPGRVTGLYGRVRPDDDNGYGFFGGLWRNGNGEMAGYLKGKYLDGYFYGIWRCLETGAWGPVVGSYYPVPTTSSTDECCRFEGVWATINGQTTGYLKGTWAPLVTVEPEGRFNGQWMYNNQLTAASIAPDGKLAGNYGVAVFRDGTRVHYFNGLWRSANEDSRQGRLGGLVVEWGFYGLWNTADNSQPQGYLKGAWGNNRFRGVWGHFDQSLQGRLWGTYRPFPTLEPVEEQPLRQDQALTLAK
ncbi:hypothetical protein ACFLUH_00080 [Chloroflexota bacterium]